MSLRRLVPLLISAALLAGCDRDDPAPPAGQALAPAPTAPADTLPSAPGADALEHDLTGLASLPASEPLRLPPAGRIGWAWPRPGQSLRLAGLPEDVTLVGLDGLSTKPAQVAALKARGIYTVCRLNLTSFGPQDAGGEPGMAFDPQQAVRPGSALGALLVRRLGGCAVRGFDAVDPGDLGRAATNAAGPTEDDRARQHRLDFAGWLADQAHAAGLAILQHGALRDLNGRDQHGRVLADIFDGALSSNCQAEKSCGALSAYVNRGKLALDLAIPGGPPGTGLDCRSAERLGINRLEADGISSAVPGCD